jgi:hypothetical protein
MVEATKWTDDASDDVDRESMMKSGRRDEVLVDILLLCMSE